MILDEGYEYEVQISSPSTKEVLALLSYGGHLWFSGEVGDSGCEIRIPVLPRAADGYRKRRLAITSYVVTCADVLKACLGIRDVLQVGHDPVLNMAVSLLFAEHLAVSKARRPEAPERQS